MKSKPLQWRVTPYNDTALRRGSYEYALGDTAMHTGLPTTTTLPGNAQDGYENSFFLEA